MQLNAFTLVLATAANFAMALPSIHPIYQVNKTGSWLENLAVRSNGKILATRLDFPELVQITPSAPDGAPETIYTFPAANGLTGVTELAGKPDVFAVIALDFTSVGNNAVWTVDLSGKSPVVTLAGKIAASKVPNGLVSLSAHENAVLVTDTTLGSIWRFDFASGNYTNVIDIPATHDALRGSNGLRIHAGHVYYTNSFGGTVSPGRGFLARIPIHEDGTPKGENEIVGYGIGSGSIDDFAFDEHGNAYVAAGQTNQILKFEAKGTVSVAAGAPEALEMASPTSVRFGRGAKKNVMYVVTAGGAQGTTPGVKGAQLVEIDLTC